jgi:MFS family permease
MAHGFRHLHACGAHGGIRDLPQSLFAAGAIARLSHEFNVSAGEISALITAATAAIALTAPFTGALADVVGRKRLITASIFAIVVATLLMSFASSVPQLVVLLLLLAPPVSIIIAGLAVCAACGLLCQAVSTSYVITIVKEGRSSAVGLYASIFYIGGSVGAFLTGFAWNAAGWTGCVVMILAMQLIVAAIVSFAWER